MNNEAMKQRVKYLIEHGGVYPQPRWGWLQTVCILTIAANVISLLVAWHGAG